MPERIIALFRMPRSSLGARLAAIGTCLTGNYFDYHHHLSFDLHYQLVKRMDRRPACHIARFHFHGARAFHTSTHELGFLGIKNRIFRIEYISNHLKCFQTASLAAESLERNTIRMLAILGQEVAVARRTSNRSLATL